MTQAITIELPESLYVQLEQTATLSHQSIDKIIAQSLTHSLPPVLQDIPSQYQADVFSLLEMDVVGLQAEAQRTLPAHIWEEYHTLLDKKKQEGLSKTGTTCLDSLRYEADLITLRKGYGTVLLKQCVYQTLRLSDNQTVL